MRAVQMYGPTVRDVLLLGNDSRATPCDDVSARNEAPSHYQRYLY